MKKKIKNFVRKLKNITVVKIVKKIPNIRIKNWILPRLYYYFNLKPHHLMLDVSSRCNSLCPFCPKTIQNIRGTHMDPKIFYKVVDQAYEMGIRDSRLYTTGEPLLHPNIDEFIRYLKSKKFTVMISTNGQFMDKHFEALSLCDEVKVSIEGWDKESYEYYRKNCKWDKVQDNLSKFKEYISGKEHKPLTTIAFMVMKETDMAKFYQAWRDKVDRFVMYPVNYVFGWDNNDDIKYLSFDSEKRLKDNMYEYVPENNTSKYCDYNFGILLVTAAGNGGICCSDFTDSITYGNLGDDNVNLIDIFKNSRRKLNQRQFVNQKMDVCDNCAVFSRLTDDSQKEYDQKVAEYIGK